MDKEARVGQVYNLLRTPRLNVLYYEESLANWTNFIRGHDFVVALAGVASPFAFLKRSSAPVDTQVWFYLTLLAGFAGILKPILRVEKQIALHSELVTHYRELFHDLKCIADDIQSSKEYSGQMEKSFVRCRLREGDLQKKEPPPNRKKIRRLMALVEAEYDVSMLWYAD